MIKTLDGKENNMNRAEQIRRELEDTDFNYTLSRINGKFKIIVLYCLAEYGTVRFNEMKKYIPYISFKMLSTTLKELEADHLVLRKEYPQVPPKVEYSLTDCGNSLLPIFDSLCEWGEVNREEE